MSGSSYGSAGSAPSSGERENVGRILDAQGDVVRRSAGSPPPKGTTTEVREYIQAQPFSAALLAIGFGYIIGRLRIL